MKIEFYDLETGKAVEGNYMVDGNGTVYLIETNCGEYDIGHSNNIGWRVVEEEQGLVVDWSKIPKRCRWAAMDEDGDTYAYNMAPSIAYEYGNKYWILEIGYQINIDSLVISKPSPDKWRESLIQRPEGV